MNTVFCLAISVVVARGDHFQLNLKVLHKLLSKVLGKSTVFVRDNRERVFMNSQYLI
jgi:hypothetical protein